MIGNKLGNQSLKSRHFETDYLILLMFIQMLHFTIVYLCLMRHANQMHLKVRLGPQHGILTKTGFSGFQI